MLTTNSQEDCAEDSGFAKTFLDHQPGQPRPGLRPREGQKFGDYELVRLLGEGGMGSVYEAQHLSSERRVALKILKHELDSPEARQRFLREGRLAAAVNHPNSVYIFGSEEFDGVPVITMELLPGGTLKDQVKQKGPLPITEAVDAIIVSELVILQVAAAAVSLLRPDRSLQDKIAGTWLVPK